MDKYLEKDVQWKFIKSMEFRDENTITIINERNHTFELNINTLEVKCVNVKNNVFRCNFRAKERYKCISGDINKIFEKGSPSSFVNFTPLRILRKDFDLSLFRFFRLICDKIFSLDLIFIISHKFADSNEI